MTDCRWLEIDVLWHEWVRKQEVEGKVVLSLRICIPLICDQRGDDSIYQELAIELRISEEEFRQYYFTSRRFELLTG